MDLEERVDRLERGGYRLRLGKADVLSLQSGDVVALNIRRPIASDERQAIVNAWADLMQRTGHADVPLVILAGEDLELKVIREEPSEVASG